MSEPRAKIIFHIGQHKTGSKALQSFMAHNSCALRERGIIYPTEENPSHGIRAYAISHYRMFSLLRREVMDKCAGKDASESFWAKQREFCLPFDTLRGMFQYLEVERERIGAHTILLSAEDLFDMHSAHETGFSVEWIEAGAKILARIADEFHYDPTVVVYLRRQDHLLGAHYVQYIKGSPVNDIDFESFAATFAPRLQARKILEQWISAFGMDRVQVRPYEPCFLTAGIVPDFFGHVLGFPVPTDWASPPRDPESINATPGRDHVEFIRILNRQHRQGLPVFPREDVLEAALSDPSAAGIAAWLSPESRRDLLEIHAQDNAWIAANFLGQPGKPLFNEPFPMDDADWHEYPGLSTERAATIARNIQKIMSRRLAA